MNVDYDLSRVEADGTEVTVYEALVEREEKHHVFGLKFCGGKSEGLPIQIAQVRPGSPAHKIGLKAGDEVTEIGDTPTANLTSYAANSLILEYGLSLILTLERRARGAIPNNPVISHPAPVQHAKHYQPYDMSGKSPAPRHPPPAPAAQYDFQTAQSRPYDQTPGQRGQPQRAQAPQASYQPTPQYDVHDEPDLGGVQQSRTFKMLASLMQNEGGGDVVIPKPGPTIHNAQYNTPMGLYSKGNVSDSLSKKIATVGLADETDTPCAEVAPDERHRAGRRQSEVFAAVKDLDDKKEPEFNRSRGSVVPKSRVRVLESYARKELDAERIGNEAHAKELKARRSVTDENDNVKFQSSITITPTAVKNGRSNASADAVIQASLSQPNSKAYSVGELKPSQTLNSLNDASSNADSRAGSLWNNQNNQLTRASNDIKSAGTPTKSYVSPSGIDPNPDVGKSPPSFLKPKGPPKQWKPVRLNASNGSGSSSNGGSHGSSPLTVQHARSSSAPVCPPVSPPVQPLLSPLTSEHPTRLNFNGIDRSLGSAVSASSLDDAAHPAPALHQHPVPSVTMSLAGANHPPHSPPYQPKALATQFSDENTRGAPGQAKAKAHVPDAPNILSAADDVPAGIPHQSRTFRRLEEFVQDDGAEPHSGSSGLPPPRSHATEQRKAAEAAAKQNPSRVKVFMPQQYNTPLGMYSAENVVDSFQQQAEVQLGGGVNGGPNGPGMSEAQRACIEQDNTTRNHQQEAVAPYGTDF